MDERILTKTDNSYTLYLENMNQKYGNTTKKR